MTICDTNILGCQSTNTLIGLNDEGKKLIKLLQSDTPIIFENLTDDQRTLFQALDNHGYFSNEKPVTQLEKASLHVTSRCNLKCEGCYSYEDSRNEKQDLSLEQIKYLLDNLAEAGIVRLAISGGEPFMRDDIVEILKYAKVDLGIKSIICVSNGIATTTRYLEAAKYVDELSFSMDGFDNKSSTIRLNDEFDSMVDKMATLKDQGVNVSIIFTLHKNNLRAYHKLEAFADGLNIPCYFSLYAVEEFNENKSSLILDDQDYDFLFSISGKKINDSNIQGNNLQCRSLCGMGQKVISIGSNGNIYPCTMFTGYDDYLMGNALNDKVSEIIKSKANRYSTLSVDNIEKCKDCHVKYICGGGCRFRSYTLTKNIFNADANLCKGQIFHIEHILLQASQK